MHMAHKNVLLQLSGSDAGKPFCHESVTVQPVNLLLSWRSYRQTGAWPLKQSYEHIFQKDFQIYAQPPRFLLAVISF